MNYAVNYEFWIDKTSSQYKAPFNQLYNEARVFTYKDTAVVTPNSDTPYSFVCLDLRAEPFVLSVPAVEKNRYYALQLTDWNTFNYGYIGSRATGSEAGDYLVVGPDWKGQTPPGIKKVFQSSTPFTIVIYRTQLFNPKDMPNVVNIQSGYKVQPLSAYLKQPAPPAPPGDRVAEDRQGTREDELLRVPGFRPAVCSRRTGRKGDPRQARPHRHRPGQDLQLQGPLPGAQGRDRARDERGRRKGGCKGREPSARRSTAGASVRPLATGITTTVTGSSARRRQRPAFTATTQSRPSTR